MSDVAKAIADYMDAQGLGTVATDIFYDQTPVESLLPTATAVITVIESGGFDPEINKDRKHYNPTIQVMVTGTQDSNANAKVKVAAVADLLTDPLDLTVGSTVFYSTAQVGGNNFLGYNVNNRPEWSLNFRLRRRESNA